MQPKLLLALAVAIVLLPAASSQTSLATTSDVASANVEASDVGASDAAVSGSLPPVQPPTVPALPVVDPTEPLSIADPVVDPVTDVADGVLGSSTVGDLVADAQDLVADPSGPTSEPAPAQETSASAVASQVVAAVEPAARSALATLLLGAFALGADGLRGLQLRVFGLFGRGTRLAALLAGSMPLFSRIERGAVMENPVRARVHEVVVQQPGVSLSEIGPQAGIAWGTTVHHLQRLEQHGLIVSLREKSHRRYFAANSVSAAERAAIASVLHPTARRIAEFVAHTPGTDQAGLCLALGLNNPSASKHLSQFEQQGLVLSQRSGRSRLYHATSGLRSALRLLQATPETPHIHPALAVPVEAS